MKTPNNPKLKESYRWKDAISILHQEIQKHKLAEFCMVQSFDFEALKEFERLNEQYISEQRGPKIETNLA